jgi:hypothetical protein
MDNKELKHIIESITDGEGMELAAIARRAKVNRSHLSTLINSEEAKPVTDSFVGKIKKQFPAYFSNQQHRTPTDSNIEANLMAIARSLANLENGQHYIRAEVRGYGQYQIQQEVGWDQKKFLEAMAKVGMIVGANLQAGDLQGSAGTSGS